MSLLPTILQSTLMGVVEGITEYLPISSTGHLILVKETLGFEMHDAYEVVIQTGAVAAVLVEYFRRFLRLFRFRDADGTAAKGVGEKQTCSLAQDFSSRPRRKSEGDVVHRRDFPTMESAKKTSQRKRLFFDNAQGFAGFNGWLWLALTTLPACVLGVLLHDALKDALFNTRTVLLSLAIGGVVMIVLERLLPDRAPADPASDGIDAIGWRRALGVGLFQCLAMVPGTSRSMCTIMGGRLLGLDRKTAAEYSFFAAVPVLVLAGVWDLFKSLGTLTRADLLPYAVGILVSFVVALLSIRFLIRMLSRHTLEAFGWYRIALALLAFLLLR